MVNRGEVWWVTSHNHSARPYLVITRPEALRVLHQVLAVPVTRTIRHIPTEVLLDVDDGMPHECALALDNTTLIPKQLFTERICRLGPAKMEEVCVALKYATGC